MIHLLNTPTCLEHHLLIAGLSTALKGETIDLYGGPFVPGADFDKLLEAAKQGTLAGLVALRFTESSVCSFDAPTRALVGQFLQKAPANCRFVADRLSVEWAPHFGFNAQLGGHPGWLGTVARIDESSGDELLPPALGDVERGVNTHYVARTVGAAIWCALLNFEMVLEVQHPWGKTDALFHHELVRWAERVGAQDLLWYPEQAQPKPRAIPRDVVEQQQHLARETLAYIVKTHNTHTANTVAGILSAAGLGPALGGVSPSPPPAPAPGPSLAAGRPRELILGTVFDPATHYSPEYYGGGAGLLFTRPDGTKDIYHATAHEWGGFSSVVRYLNACLALPPGTTLLDIGCGAGGFVGYAAASGLDAYGVDLSEAAFTAAAPGVRKRLVCADITKTELREQLALGKGFDVVTALDFWEHIFERDLPALIQATKKLLKPGGYGFFVICTRGQGEPDWTIKPGDVFTKENSWLLASGHVTIRRLVYWIHKFSAEGFKIRNDLAFLFEVLRDEDPGLRSTESWRCKNLLMVQRP